MEMSVAGAMLVLFVGFWVAGYRQYLAIRVPPPGALEVYVTAKQWMWKFHYPSGQSTAGYVVVPAGRPVEMLLTSRDVIHSFYVPELRVKQDALPGRYTSMWFRADRAGTVQARCAEYCGVSHSRMWADVVVLDPGDYSRWLEGSAPPRVAAAEANAAASGRAGDEDADLAERGGRLAVRYGCTACHTIDGQPHIGPSWAGTFGSVRTFADGETTVADESYLTESMMDPEERRVAGFEAVMPTYRGLIQGPEVAALVAYIKSLRDRPVAPAVNLEDAVP
jgi:cytochrome c oxidase subunit 2